MELAASRLCLCCRVTKLVPSGCLCMASQLVPRVFCVTAVPKQREIFACTQALVHGVVLKRKQPPIAAVNGGLWKR